MAFKFFLIPIGESETAEAEMNAFLNSHKVLSIDRRWVDQGSQSFWSFCVDFLPGAATGSKPSSSPIRNGHQRERIDYRETLPPEQFAIFARLRDLRKEIAQAESMPVYAIFSNEQLANMVRQRVTTKTALQQLPGIGEAKADKYGPRFLELLGTAWEPANEESEPTVREDHRPGELASGDLESAEGQASAA